MIFVVEPKIKYFYKNGTNDFAGNDERNIINRAFRFWSDVSGLTLTETNSEDDADIIILFATGEHGHGSPGFPDNELAHAFYPSDGGDCHFNDNYNFNTNYSLFTVALHEIGHCLGLGHSDLFDAVMYPSIKLFEVKNLHSDDIDGIRLLYPDLSELNQWKYLSGGEGNWINMIQSNMWMSKTKFGDFNNDNKEDVLTSVAGRLMVSYSGTDNWTHLNRSNVNVSNIRTGDFDGDGKTDILTKTSDNSIKYLQGGKGRWITLNKTKATLGNMRFGDFDGDGKTDILTKTSDNSIKYLQGGKGRWITLNKTKATLGNMRFGDFDGDGKTDIITLVGLD